MQELIELWNRLLGRAPSEQQFAVWFAMHDVDTVRRGIIRTATKNMQLAGEMDDDYRIRYASSVMLNRVKRLESFGRALGSTSTAAESFHG